MNTEITHAINASKDKAQYDTHAKRLLSQKIILAHILVKVIDEFKDMKPEQVMAYIEGDPIIGTIPVDPGLTNQEQFDDSGQRIVGLNTENADIKDEILDPYNWKGNLNLLNIVMIGIAKELPKHEEKYELHRLIAALLSNQLNEQQRLAILESEYNIPINTDFRKDVNVMCNLGQGIEDRAIAETTAKIILNMYHSGYSLAQIADAVEMTETEVLDIITSASA